MRLVLALLSLAVATPQDEDDLPPVRWPKLSATAPTAAGFVPRGWIIEVQRRGDVDGDGVADLAMILHQRSPTNVLHRQGLGVATLDTNPRLLVVAKGQRGGPFHLLLQNHTLVPRWDSPTIDDPFDDPDAFAIRGGALVVPLHLFANAGGWTTFERTFTLRIATGRCVLIGFDEQRVVRNTGAATTTSINYLTGARAIATSAMDSDGPMRTRRTRLPRRALLFIEQIGDGIEFEPR